MSFFAIASTAEILRLPSLTPADAFDALRSRRPFALLESAHADSGVRGVHPDTARKSFLGLGPRPMYRCPSGRRGDVLRQMQDVLDGWRERWPGHDAGVYGCLFLVFAYEWKNVLERLPQRSRDDMGFPWASVVECRDLLVWDHRLGTISIYCTYRKGNAGSHLRARTRSSAIRNALLSDRTCPREDFFADSPERSMAFPAGWRSNMSREEYCKKVRRIKRYIAQGDIYQANVSQRFQTETCADGFTLYRTLRRINPSPFAGYLRLGPWELISCSPERLVRKEGDILSTRPIAGTRPRGASRRMDGRLRDELMLSPKERAEHIMLVDLERSDLGRVCGKGSVRVNEMMSVEKYSHVQHIVSNVQGRLRGGAVFADVLKAVFPGGTITGVPKIRCMEILDEVEPTARGPYTGSFGYIDNRGDFDLNIAIRTLLKKGRSIWLQTGAGIVADSDPAAEYDETVHKAKAMALAVEECSDIINHL